MNNSGPEQIPVRHNVLSKYFLKVHQWILWFVTHFENKISTKWSLYQRIAFLDHLDRKLVNIQENKINLLSCKFSYSFKKLFDYYKSLATDYLPKPLIKCNGRQQINTAKYMFSLCKQRSEFADFRHWPKLYYLGKRTVHFPNGQDKKKSPQFIYYAQGLSRYFFLRITLFAFSKAL